MSIGGIEQWVTITGDDCSNPVILFLHGGPGNTLSPYAYEIYGSWTKTFTLVQWDQRGAGRTYGRSATTAGLTLTIERMADDGVELARYLTERLGKRKIILTGGSWGSILGVHMVKAHPELFLAYVGVAQIVDYRENQTASYAQVMALAKRAGHERTLVQLEALGPPPWENPRHLGILRRAMREFEAETSVAAPHTWWVRSADYATPKMIADYTAGEDYSFLEFVGLNGNGMFSTVDLPSLGLAFDLPVFFVHGSEDLLATPDVARRYFESITAPQKGFVLVPKSGHDPNVAMLDAQHTIMRQLVVPKRP